MPKVPQRLVQDKPIGAKRVSARVDPRAFGTSVDIAPVAGAITRSFVDTETRIDALRLRQRKKAEQLTLSSARTKYQAEANRLMNDPRNGYLLNRGKDALSAQESVKKRLSDYRKKNIDTLFTTDSLKTNGKDGLDRIDNGFGDKMNNHSLREIQRYERDETLANIDRLQVDSRDRFDEFGAPDKDGNRESIVAINIKEIKDTIAGYGESIGESPVVTKQKQLEATSKTYEKVAIKMLNDDRYDDARELINQADIKGDMDPEIAGALKEKIDNASVLGESQQLAGQIMSSSAFKTDADRLDAARNISDNPKVTEKLVREVKTQSAEQKAAEKFVAEEFYQGLTDSIYKDPTTFNPTASMNARLTATQQASLGRLKHNLIMEQRGVATRTDTSVWLKLDRLPHEELKKIDLNSFAHKLSLTDIKSFAKRQKSSSDHTNSQNLTSFTRSMVKEIGEDEGTDEAVFMRNMFTDELNKYPKDQRDRQETWTKVRDNMLMDMDVSWAFFTQPLWETRFKNKKTEGPKGTTEIDKTVNGVHIKGWLGNDPAGEPIVYDAAGNVLYQFKKKKQ